MANKEAQGRAATKEEKKACLQLISTWASDEHDSFPPELKELLKLEQAFPRILVNEKEPPVLAQPYEARLYDRLIQVQPPTAITPADPVFALRFRAHVVPMVPATPTFPADHFVAVDLKAPEGGARVVVTAALAGCSFVIGFDKKNKNRILLGHAQAKNTLAPVGTGTAELSTPALLAKHFREAHGKTIFEGQEVQDVYVMGGDSKGYGDDIADVLGWVSGGKLFLAVMTRAGKTLSIHQYPPSLLSRLLHK